MIYRNLSSGWIIEWMRYVKPFQNTKSNHEETINKNTKMCINKYMWNANDLHGKLSVTVCPSVIVYSLCYVCESVSRRARCTYVQFHRFLLISFFFISVPSRLHSLMCLSVSFFFLLFFHVVRCTKSMPCRRSIHSKTKSHK